MMIVRVLPVLLVARVAAAQISTPPPCRGAITDRVTFHTPAGGPIKFHMKFHDATGAFDARVVVKLHRRAPDASCNAGDVVDTVIDKLVEERTEFLPPP